MRKNVIIKKTSAQVNVEVFLFYIKYNGWVWDDGKKKIYKKRK